MYSSLQEEIMLTTK